MKNTSLTALGGIITALSIFLLFLTGMIPNTTYLLPVFAAILMLPMLEEAERKWAWFIYIAVSVLSFFIVTDKEAAVMYVFVFGYYPILKQLLEAHFKKPIAWIFKLLIYNLMIVAAYLLIIYVFLIPVDGLDYFGKWTPLLLLALMDLILIVYDYLVTVLSKIYQKSYADRVHKLFRH